MNSAGQGPIYVAEMVELLERMAPPYLAESWDNCGLQVGSRQWPVKKVWVALDPLLKVVLEAAEQNVDLLITHHPLIFKPLKTIDLDTPEGKIISTAIKAQMAVYAAHTNLDSAKNGINEMLARKIGLKNLQPLVPASHDETHAGKILQTESMGMGRLGHLNKPVTVIQLAEEIKGRLGLSHIKMAGKSSQRVRKVAVCSGSGGGLISHFLASGAEVFISGDLRYHDARAVEHAGRALIDIGHFASEHLMVDAFCNQLAGAINKAGWNVESAPCRMERDPFELI